MVQHVKFPFVPWVGLPESTGDKGRGRDPGRGDKTDLHRDTAEVLDSPTDLFLYPSGAIWGGRKSVEATWTSRRKGSGISEGGECTLPPKGEKFPLVGTRRSGEGSSSEGRQRSSTVTVNDSVG